MKVIDPGHEYELDYLDGHLSSTLSQKGSIVFVKREGLLYPGNVGAHPGVTMQELLRVGVHRMQHVDGQAHDDINIDVVEHLRQSIYLLELRAARRRGSALPFRRWASGRDFPPNAIRHDIELEPVCRRCGHIRCAEVHL